MSFGTKTSMWWGTVKTNTEHFFGKEQKRLTTHEFYNNPKAPSERPKSMHTIASQSKRSIGGGNGDSGSVRRKSSRKGSERGSSVSGKGSGFYAGVDNGNERQSASGFGGQDVANAAMNPGEEYQQNPYEGQQQQWGGDYVQDPNAMMFQQNMYPGGDPTMMGFQQDFNGMGYDQVQMFGQQQDPNMMMGGYPQGQNMFPQQPGDPNMMQQQGNGYGGW